MFNAFNETFEDLEQAAKEINGKVERELYYANNPGERIKKEA